jgi:hypothetical protein
MGFRHFMIVNLVASVTHSMIHNLGASVILILVTKGRRRDCVTKIINLGASVTGTPMTNAPRSTIVK